MKHLLVIAIVIACLAIFFFQARPSKPAMSARRLRAIQEYEQKQKQKQRIEAPTIFADKSFLVDDVNMTTTPYISNHKLYKPYLQQKLGITNDADLFASSELTANSSIVRSTEGEMIGNQFLRLFHLAYADHYAMAIKPDDIWLHLMQQLSIHVQLHAEQFREQLVAHKEGKKEIKVLRNDFMAADPRDNDWLGAIQDLSVELQKHIPAHIHDMVVNNFSTTTMESRVASQIVLMDAMQSYFTYVVETLCGIPKIRILGTEQDWQSVMDRLPLLGKFGLQKYVDHVLPIVNEFKLAAMGTPNVGFWQNAYKLLRQSGGAAVTGWITKLFYYIRGYNNQPMVNYIYQENINEKTLDMLSFEGYKVTSFSTVWSKCPVIWRFFVGEAPLTFIAGHSAVIQHDETLELSLQIGYAVQRNK